MNKELRERTLKQIATLTNDLRDLYTQVAATTPDIDEVWQRFDGIESQFGFLTESIDEMED